MGENVTFQEKSAVVTGANSGIGFETARALAKIGYHVLMVCRDRARGVAAQNGIAANAKGRPPTLFVGDLSSQAEIRRLAEEIRVQSKRIDVLVNNAGGVFAKRQITVDGIEATFATNHLASFLLTNLLLDPLLAAPEARVINVASDAYAAKLDFDNLQGERQYDFFSAYRRSKLENILFTFELARRLQATSVTANCMSPGPSRTRFGDNLTGVARLFPLVMKNIPFLFRSPERGAETCVFLATTAAGRQSGKYFFRNRIHATNPATLDREVAGRLWRISEQLTGLNGSESILKPSRATASA